MNQLTKLFEGNEIRIVGNEENPLFMLADVCEALGLSNPSEVSKRVRDKYKHKISLGLHGRSPIFVNEQGLYQVIMRADSSPVAERFQDWVYEDVLPSIRKSGKYELPQLTPAEITLRLAQQQADQENRILLLEDKVDNQMTIDYGQQLVIQNAKKRRVEYLWNDLSDTSVYFETKQQLYSRIGSDLNRAFATSSYRNILRKDFEEAVTYVKAWRPALV